MSGVKASRKYGIPQRTLYHKMKKIKESSEMVEFNEYWSTTKSKADYSLYSIYLNNFEYIKLHLCEYLSSQLLLIIVLSSGTSSQGVLTSSSDVNILGFWIKDKPHSAVGTGLNLSTVKVDVNFWMTKSSTTPITGNLNMEIIEINEWNIWWWDSQFFCWLQ